MIWRSPYLPGASLRLGNDVVLHTSTGDRQVSRGEFDAGALAVEGIGALGHARYVEVLAVLRHGPLPVGRPPARPSVSRSGGFVRGKLTAGYWIFGHRARFSNLEGEVPLSDIAGGGLPRGHGLTRRVADALVHAAVLLSPLPCMCGTGTQAHDEHGSLDTLVEPVQEPFAPVTATASVGRCRVCGLVWVMTEAGDDHYDWRRTMEPFAGPEA